MIDIVKVREGLKNCAEVRGSTHGCMICPFDEEGEKYVTGCCVELLRQAYQLLKPRLLTKDELQGEGRPFTVWVEDLFMNNGEPFQAAFVDGAYEDSNVTWCLEAADYAPNTWAGYGIKWRCWTQWPSDEDRRREPWDDEKEGHGIEARDDD